MMEKRTVFVLVVVFALATLLLAGCRSDEPTPAPSAALPAKTVKPTFTPVPTWTLVPTATAMPAVEPTEVPTEVPTATTVPSPTIDANLNPLTGLPASDPSLLSRRVLAVRIGNDSVIRPQDGIGQAEIVYEEIMEGWTLTRFTALFLEKNAERVRPLRSARLSSLEIAPQWDAALVHSGASDKIRWLISQASFVDLDQYYHEQPYAILNGYDWRGRMYTSVEAIHSYLVSQGKDKATSPAPLPFDADAPAGSPATSIHIPYPKACVVDWAYDTQSGLYLRTQEGEPHLDGLSDEQIAAANVIVLYAEHGKTDIVEDSLGSTAIDIRLDTQGKVAFCRDGVVVEGTWKRVAENKPIQFFDNAGGIVSFKPGQTWIQLVPIDYEVAID